MDVEVGKDVDLQPCRAVLARVTRSLGMVLDSQFKDITRGSVLSEENEALMIAPIVINSDGIDVRRRFLK